MLLSTSSAAPAPVAVTRPAVVEPDVVAVRPEDAPAVSPAAAASAATAGAAVHADPQMSAPEADAVAAAMIAHAEASPMHEAQTGVEPVADHAAEPGAGSEPEAAGAAPPSVPVEAAPVAAPAPDEEPRNPVSSAITDSAFAQQLLGNVASSQAYYTNNYAALTEISNVFTQQIQHVGSNLWAMLTGTGRAG